MANFSQLSPSTRPWFKGVQWNNVSALDVRIANTT